jgi:hypothetical protein
MDHQQLMRICELLGDIKHKFEYIEMQTEDYKHTVAVRVAPLSRRRELKLEEINRVCERQHGVVAFCSEGEDEID